MPVTGSSPVSGTTQASDNAPTYLGAPGTYGATARGAVASPPLTTGVVTTDGRKDNVADTLFATALAAKNAPATGATAGAPGAWTPSGCVVPARIADAPAPTVATAWTAGQYILLQGTGAAAEINWSGTAWVAGRHA